MKRIAFAAASVISLVVIAFVSILSHTAHGSAEGSVGTGGGTPGTSSNFTLVGHDPLFNRGMNTALAIFDHFVYIGNRTDGSATCNGGGTGCPHPHPRGLNREVSKPPSPQEFAQLPQPVQRE